MFHRLRMGKRVDITPEQYKRKEEAEAQQELAKSELSEAKELAIALRKIREKNHFAESFRESLGGHSGR